MHSKWSPDNQIRSFFTFATNVQKYWRHFQGFEGVVGLGAYVTDSLPSLHHLSVLDSSPVGRHLVVRKSHSFSSSFHHPRVYVLFQLCSSQQLYTHLLLCTLLQGLSCCIHVWVSTRDCPIESRIKSWRVGVGDSDTQILDRIVTKQNYSARVKGTCLLLEVACMLFINHVPNPNPSFRRHGNNNNSFFFWFTGEAV